MAEYAALVKYGDTPPRFRIATTGSGVLLLQVCLPIRDYRQRRKAAFRPRLAQSPCCLNDYRIRVIIRYAETGLVPPANGVMVSAVLLPAGLRTVSTELATVVKTSDVPAI